MYCMVAPRRIIIVPLTTHNVLDYLEALVNEVKAALSKVGVGDIDVVVWPEVIKPPMRCFDWSRIQYHAACILKYLREVFQVIGTVNTDFIIGVGYLDGYEQGLNFVFGEAMPGQNVAAVFTRRLKPEFYGEKPSFDLYFQRLVKEVLHELGHLFNLEHCSNYCVMRFSNSVYEVDEKPVDYCESCKSKVIRYMSRTK